MGKEQWVRLLHQRSSRKKKEKRKRINVFKFIGVEKKKNFSEKLEKWAV